MFRLIVGLGNPGKQYEKTRHNVGFWFVDRLAADLVAEWSMQARFHGLLANSYFSNRKIILLKPQTFMNRSGQSVVALMRYYDIKPDELLVVHDELDFEAGLIRFKNGGGHAGHNGLRDIMSHLGSRDFFRLRVGVDRPVRQQKGVADYVLSEPSKIDKDKIEQAMDLVMLNKDLLYDGKIEQLMNRLH